MCGVWLSYFILVPRLQPGPRHQSASDAKDWNRNSGNCTEERLVNMPLAFSPEGKHLALGLLVQSSTKL